MLDILIVDDESLARQRLERMVTDLGHEVAGEAKNAAEAMALIEKLDPAIVLLDIEMPGETGIQLAARVSQLDQPPAIIFTTAYDQYAIQAFQYSALDYLLKPIDPDRLITVVQKCLKEKNDHQSSDRLKIMQDGWGNKETETIIVNNDQGYHFILLTELMRLSSDRGTTAFHTEHQPVITVAKNIGDFAKMLPESSFFRCHQSHIVNFRWVSSYLFQDGGTIIMRDKTPVPLARARREEFIKRIKAF